MTVSQVLYTLAVADCGNMSQAAQRLYVSQSAISQQISRLEQELGYPLFARTSYGLELTAAGDRFCREARPVIEAWQKLCRDFQSDGPTARKQLRIGVGSRVYSNGLFRELVAFFEQRPELEVSFVTEAGVDFLRLMRQQRVDLVLDRLPAEDYLLHQSEYYTCPLIRERQCVLLAPEDPRAALPALTLQDLQGSTMISGLENSAEARTLRELCRAQGIRLHRVYRCDGIETGMRLVHSGVGLALGPQSFADYFQVAAVPLDPETHVSLQLVCPRALLQRREIRQVRDRLVQLCRESGHPEAGNAEKL